MDSVFSRVERGFTTNLPYFYPIFTTNLPYFY